MKQLQFTLVPPGNPKISSALNPKDRYLAISKLPRIKGLCKWCFAKPNMSHRHLYCSQDCQLSAQIYCYPQGSLSRAYLHRRQDGVCAHCDHVFESRHDSEVDHINPIFKGGAALGSENHQLLCKVCHLRKTVSERLSHVDY